MVHCPGPVGHRHGCVRHSLLDIRGEGRWTDHSGSDGEYRTRSTKRNFPAARATYTLEKSQVWPPLTSYFVRQGSALFSSFTAASVRFVRDEVSFYRNAGGAYESTGG